MNIDNNLILIKGEDKTTSVTAWRFDQQKPVVFVTYNGQKEYPYNTAHVEFFKNPQIRPRFLSSISTQASAAGVTPEMRPACPSVRGFTLFSFSWISRESPAMSV